MGKGVMKAVSNVNDILGPAVKGRDPTQQKEIDQIMLDLDGTPNKANLGANAILGVSLAVCKAGAGVKRVPLYQHFADLAGNKESKFTMPVPCFNVINGGSHGGNKLAFQEFFVIPTGATSFNAAMQIGCEVRMLQTLRDIVGKIVHSHVFSRFRCSFVSGRFITR
jgi:enolase